MEVYFLCLTYYNFFPWVQEEDNSSQMTFFSLSNLNYHLAFLSIYVLHVCKWGGGPPWQRLPSGSGERQAVEDATGLLKVLLRERLAAVPDRLGMKGQMVFD